jgi:hypothetical protein
MVELILHSIVVYFAALVEERPQLLAAVKQLVFVHDVVAKKNGHRLLPEQLHRGLEDRFARLGAVDTTCLAPDSSQFGHDAV